MKFIYEIEKHPPLFKIKEFYTFKSGIYFFECMRCKSWNIYRNKLQADIDEDFIGDMCDADIDNDDILNNNDNCPQVAKLTF